MDGDKFSAATPGLRGYHWRGKDCDAADKSVYPGRSTANSIPGFDYNCNGIKGVGANGVNKKDLYCKNSK